MDLRPSTLKALFLEGMRKADEDDVPETPPPPAKPPTRWEPPPGAVRDGLGYMEWRNGRPFHITPPPLPEPEPEPDEDDQDDEPVDGDQEGEEPEEGKTGRLARWRPTLQRVVEPGSRPAPYEVRPAPRQSAADWWRGLDVTRRWMLYNGAALAAGFALHIPQVVTSRTAYVVTTYHSWADVHVITCYVIAAVVWTVDRVTRRWPFLFALILRVPLASLVIGALLYGRTDIPS